jgi:hypothetical protein
VFPRNDFSLSQLASLPQVAAIACAALFPGVDITGGSFLGTAARYFQASLERHLYEESLPIIGSGLCANVDGWPLPEPFLTNPVITVPI